MERTVVPQVSLVGRQHAQAATWSLRRRHGGLRLSWNTQPHLVSTEYKCATFRHVCRRQKVGDNVVRSASDDSGPDAPSSSSRCVILECDGVLMDVHNEGHRVAFNKAFEEIGYNCVQWSPAIYFDLMRLGDSTGPGLIRTYYEMMGWPIMLSTADRPAFVQKVYEGKQRIFKEMVSSASIPLREGVAQFIDDLLEDGVCPVVLAGTASAPGDSVVSCAMMNLGPNRAFKMQVLTLGERDEDSEEGQGAGSENLEENGKDAPGHAKMSFEQQVLAAQNAAKSKVATSFARSINLQNLGVGMRVDPSLLAAQQRAGLSSPGLFSAISSVMGCGSSDSTILIAASNSLMEAAKAAGITTAGMPPSLSARGGFSAMDWRFDGFGAGSLTWKRLKSMTETK